MRRKLIRPSLRNIIQRNDGLRTDDDRRISDILFSPNEGIPLAAQTFMETEYYQQLISKKKTIVIILKDGSIIEGYMEYYDKRFIRVTRKELPNIFLMKQDIKYFYEKTEDSE